MKNVGGKASLFGACRDTHVCLCYKQTTWFVFIQEGEKLFKNCEKLKSPIAQRSVSRAAADHIRQLKSITRVCT